MSEQQWPCRHENQFDLFVNHIKQNWDWSKVLSIKWSVGEKKSLGQNALIHVWIRHITLHMNKLPENDYDEETVKTYIKRRFGIRIESKDLLTGEPMPALKSFSRYEKGEMTALMNKVEEFAACIGCTLPMYGEYLELRGAA